MKRMQRASKAFMLKSVSKQVSDGNTITAALLQSEPDFKNLPFKNADLINMNSDLSKAETSAQTGDKNARAQLKEVREKWKQMFGQTADAVTLDANGSETMILKAGMTPTSATGRKLPQPGQPANTVAKPGTGKGDCAISVDGQEGVHGYIGILAPPDTAIVMKGDTVAITMTTPGTVYLKACTRRAMQIDGLPSYTPFCATVFTFNSAGSSPLSNSEEMATQ